MIFVLSTEEAEEGWLPRDGSMYFRFADVFTHLARVVGGGVSHFRDEGHYRRRREEAVMEGGRRLIFCMSPWHLAFGLYLCPFRCIVDDWG